MTHFSVVVKVENQWQGEGNVDILMPNQQIVVWKEKGQWDSSLNNLEFSNSYRWTLIDKSEIQLEHLRYGEKQPVRLVNIRARQDGLWESTEPHQCGQDNYQLELQAQENCLILSWQITGPQKNQLSKICYI